jgi:hypothetical protein
MTPTMQDIRAAVKALNNLVNQYDENEGKKPRSDIGKAHFSWRENPVAEQMVRAGVEKDTPVKNIHAALKSMGLHPTKDAVASKVNEIKNELGMILTPAVETPMESK